MAGNMMCMWTVASYDYALQVLKAQQQFTHSMLVAAAPMLNVVRDITSTNSNEDRPANNRLGARGDQRHEDSRGSRKNERYNDDDSAEYNKRLVDNNSPTTAPRTPAGPSAGRPRPKSPPRHERASPRIRLTASTPDRSPLTASASSGIRSPRCRRHAERAVDGTAGQLDFVPAELPYAGDGKPRSRPAVSSAPQRDRARGIQWCRRAGGSAGLGRTWPTVARAGRSR